MSTSLLRHELTSEIEQLDKRYNEKPNSTKNKTKKSNSASRGVKSHVKKYKANPKVDQLANSLQSSQESVDLANKKKTQANIEKLLKLSASTAAKGLAVNSILEYTEVGKRSYEPKGRTLLDRPAKSKKQKVESSIFTDQDFEKFSREYFVNSKPIANLGKVDGEDQ
jgi:hypothetical protein